MAGQNLVGLDIGTSSIKVCHLKETKKGVQLLAFDSISLPPGTVRDGQVMHAPQLSERIQEVFQVNKIRHRRAAIAMSGNAVIIKKISLPEMTEEELEDSIQWEAEQYIPFDIKDVNVDAQIINPKAGQGQMDVLLVAAKRGVIDEVAEVVRDARIDPVVVDVDAFALFNCFELNHDVPREETVALVNIGASTINVHIVADGVSVFTRDLTVGGNLLTEEISKQFAVPWDEAEHMKTSSETTLSMSGVLREVQRISERVSEQFVSEIQRSLDFFAATSMAAEIATLYLSGGAALQIGLIEGLERRLGAEVRAMHPFQHIEIDPKRFDVASLQRLAPVAAVAVGLARRGGRGDRV